MLEYKDVRYKQVNVWDLDRYFEKVFGTNPDIVAREEWSNDTSHSYRVKGELDKGDFEDAALLAAGGFVQWGVCGLVLEVLCVNGHLEAGDYLIESWW